MVVLVYDKHVAQLLPCVGRASSAVSAAISAQASRLWARCRGGANAAEDAADADANDKDLDADAGEDAAEKEPWFSRVYAPWLFRYRRYVIGAHVALWIVGVYFAATLEVTPFKTYRDRADHDRSSSRSDAAKTASRARRYELLPETSNFYQFNFINAEWTAKSSDPLNVGVGAATNFRCLQGVFGARVLLNISAKFWRRVRTDELVARARLAIRRDRIRLAIRSPGRGGAASTPRMIRAAAAATPRPACGAPRDEPRPRPGTATSVTAQVNVIFGLKHRDPLIWDGSADKFTDSSGKPRFDNGFDLDPTDAQIQLIRVAEDLATNPRRGLKVNTKFGINPQLDSSTTGSLLDTIGGGRSASVQSASGDRAEILRTAPGGA